MFKLRPGSQGSAAQAQPLSIDAVRRRARHRLIGASVLVLAGVIGFPLLFDTQPRPIPVDIPIDIPARNAVPPLAAPHAQSQAQPQAPAVQVDGLGDKEDIVSRSAPVTSAPPKVEVAQASPAPSKPVAQAPVKEVAKEAVKAPAKEVKAPAKEVAKDKEPSKELAKAPLKDVAKDAAKPAEAHAGDAARAQAILEDKPSPPATPAAQRVVVQVGAFADAALAQQTRNKLERAGLKTYTHVAETPDGKRIRVRLGPFENRAQAEKAAQKVKSLGLSTAILTL